MSLRVPALLAVAGLATSAAANTFNADSVTVSGQIAADTQLDATAVGLLNINLDGLDVAPTNITGTGAASIDAQVGANSLALTTLTLDINDIIVPPFGDSDSASIFVAGLDVDVNVAQFDITNLSIELVAPTNAVPFVGESQITFNDFQARVIADVAVDISANISGSGLASALDFDLPIVETFSFDEELTLPSLTFDSTFVGDDLTLSSSIDVQDFLPLLDDELNAALGTSLDIVNSSGNIDINNDEIQALIAAAQAADPDLVPSEITDLLGLVSLAFRTNSLVANAAFEATFTDVVDPVDPNVDPTIDSVTVDVTRLGGADFELDFLALATDDNPGDILTFEWDLDGDGLFDDFVGDAGTLAVNFPGSPFDVSVRVTDGQGGEAFFTVNNVPTPGAALLLGLAAAAGARRRSR